MTAFQDSGRLYYPSMVVNLQLRFDEGLTTVQQPRSAEDLAGSDIVPTTPSLGGTEPVILQRGSDNLSQIVGLVPRSASVTLPAYRQAGTFSVELEFRDLPLDPRVIRSIAVAIHLDSVEARDFGDGMISSPLFGEGDFASGQRRSSITATNPNNILIAGVADTIATDHGDKAATVTLEGRDLRGILLDTPVAPDTLTVIDPSKPVDQVVRHIVQDLHPQGGGVRVEVDATEWPSGRIPSPATLSDVTRTNLDSLGRALKPSAKGAVQQVTFWDLITTYCFLVGAVPHFVGSVLRIRPSKSLYDARRQEQAGFAGSPNTPFKDGQPRNVGPPNTQSPEQYAYRRLVFGRGIRTLSFERKLTGVKVPVIECVSYDAGSSTRGQDRLIKVQFPPSTEEKARTTSVDPSGGAAQTDVLRVNVPGTTSKEKLQTIAESIYHEVGRQELGGSVETKNLSSFGGSNQDPDLLRLRPGDPVEFRVDASGLGVFPPPISELTSATSRSFEEQVAEVASRIGDQNLARVLVAANRGEVNELQQTFRTSNVRFNWGKDTGVAIAFDFQNFVEARYDVQSLPTPVSDVGFA